MTMPAAGSTATTGHAAAPAVEVTVGAGGWAAPALALLAATVAGVLAAWGLSLADATGVPVGAGAALAAALAGAAALWGWRRSSALPASLRWDGLDWSWSGAGLDAAPVTGSLHLVWDLDAWVLLRFDGTDRRRRWVALARARHARQWHALRCAVLAHGGGRAPSLPPGALV